MAASAWCGPHDADGDCVAGFERRLDADHILYGGDGLTVDRQDHVFFSQANVLGERSFVHAPDHQAAFALDTHAGPFSVGQGMQLDTEFVLTFLGFRFIRTRLLQFSELGAILENLRTIHDGYLEVHAFPITINRQSHRRANRGVRNARHELVAILDRFAIHRHDDVLRFDSGFVRRSALLDGADQDALIRSERLEQFGLIALGPAHADGAASDLAGLNNVVVYASHHVDGQRKSDTLIPAALGRDHGVNADHFTANVQQRTAAVAGIDGGIGLDETLKLQLPADIAAERADDSRRDRRFQSERRTNSHGPIAHLHRVGIPDEYRGQRSLRIDF